MNGRPIGTTAFREWNRTLIKIDSVHYQIDRKYCSTKYPSSHCNPLVCLVVICFKSPLVHPLHPCFPIPFYLFVLFFSHVDEAMFPVWPHGRCQPLLECSTEEERQTYLHAVHQWCAIDRECERRGTTRRRRTSHRSPR